MVAWFALGLSVLVALWAVYVELVRRPGTVAWRVRFEYPQGPAETTPWPLRVDNVGTRAAVAPSLHLWEGGQWVERASDNGVFGPGGAPWDANLSAAMWARMDPPVVRLASTPLGGRRRHIVEGRLVAPESVLTRRKPLRRWQLLSRSDAPRG
jgi:hypothetical protein